MRYGGLPEHELVDRLATYTVLLLEICPCFIVRDGTNLVCVGVCVRGQWAATELVDFRSSRSLYIRDGRKACLRRVWVDTCPELGFSWVGLDTQAGYLESALGRVQHTNTPTHPPW